MMRASKQRVMSLEGLESRQLLSVRPTLPVAAEIHSEKVLPPISGVPVQGTISGKVTLSSMHIPITAHGTVSPLGGVTAKGAVVVSGTDGTGSLKLTNAKTGSLTIALSGISTTSTSPVLVQATVTGGTGRLKTEIASGFGVLTITPLVKGSKHSPGKDAFTLTLNLQPPAAV